MNGNKDGKSFSRKLSTKEIHAVTTKGVLAFAEQRAGSLVGTARLHYISDFSVAANQEIGARVAEQQRKTIIAYLQRKAPSGSIGIGKPVVLFNRTVASAHAIPVGKVKTLSPKEAGVDWLCGSAAPRNVSVANLRLFQPGKLYELKTIPTSDLEKLAFAMALVTGDKTLSYLKLSR